MNPKVLSVVLLRSAGVISVVSGLFHAISYSLPYWLNAWQSKIGPTASGYTTSILLPSLATVIGGLLLLVFASPLSRLVVRGLETTNVADKDA